MRLLQQFFLVVAGTIFAFAGLLAAQSYIGLDSTMMEARLQSQDSPPSITVLSQCCFELLRVASFACFAVAAMCLAGVARPSLKPTRDSLPSRDR